MTVQLRGVRPRKSLPNRRRIHGRPVQTTIGTEWMAESCGWTCSGKVYRSIGFAHRTDASEYDLEIVKNPHRVVCDQCDRTFVLEPFTRGTWSADGRTVRVAR